MRVSYASMCVCITVIACSKMFFNDNFLPFRSVKMKITTRDCFRCSVVHCWFLRNAAKMELVRYDCDYRAYKRTFNASTRSKFAKGMPPHGNKGFSSAFFVFGEVSLSLSLSLVIKKLSYISSLNDKKFLAKNC